MVLKYTNKTNFIILDGFAGVCTVSANFPDNPRITEISLHVTLSNNSHSHSRTEGQNIHDLCRFILLMKKRGVFSSVKYELSNFHLTKQLTPNRNKTKSWKKALACLYVQWMMVSIVIGFFDLLGHLFLLTSVFSNL